MQKARSGNAEEVSKEAAVALKKIVKNSDLDWMFFIMEEGDYVTIVDIDYERGRALPFGVGLAQIEEMLRRYGKSIAEYNLTQAETAAYRQLLSMFLSG